MNKQQAGNQRRRTEASLIWDARREEMARLTAEGWSQGRLATHYGVTQAAIWKAMKRLGIEPRPRVNCGERNGRFRDGSASRLYRTVVVKEKCARCGTTENLGIHHVNGDHYDNRAENLQVLCNSCHMSVEKQAWWDAKKAGLPTPKSNGPVGWLSSRTRHTG